jgi:hypothetical protein
VASERDLARLAELRETRQTLTKNGFHVEADSVRREIERLNKPHVGEVLYVDPEGREAVKVVEVGSTRVAYVPLNTAVGYTHQGNLYDRDGKQTYRAGD